MCKVARNNYSLVREYAKVATVFIKLFKAIIELVNLVSNYSYGVIYALALDSQI